MNVLDIRVLVDQSAHFFIVDILPFLALCPYTIQQYLLLLDEVFVLVFEGSTEG